MIDLELSEKDLRAGLERMRQEAAELAIRILRQEAALMLAQELKRQEQASEPVIAEVEPVA